MNSIKTLEKLKEFVEARLQDCAYPAHKDDFSTGQRFALAKVISHIDGLIADQEDLKREKRVSIDDDKID